MIGSNLEFYVWTLFAFLPSIESCFLSVYLQIRSSLHLYIMVQGESDAQVCWTDYIGQFINPSFISYQQKGMQLLEYVDISNFEALSKRSISVPYFSLISLFVLLHCFSNFLLFIDNYMHNEVFTFAVVLLSLSALFSRTETRYLHR